jgi:capsular polysaccharide biosynthesis protein
MAVRKFSIRHIKAFLGRNLTRALPSLRRHLTFFDEARCMTDAGRTAIHTEQQAVRIGAENLPFARTLPVAIPRQIRRSVALIELKDVTVLGPTGAIVDERRGVLLKPRGSQQITHNDFRLVPTRIVHKPPANYFNMMDLHRGHRHYFHFLFDRLPNLYYLLHRFELGRAPITVLVNADPPQFQRDIYRFVGRRFPNLRFEAVPEGERWRVGRLYHLDNFQPISRAFASAEFIDFVRSLVIAGYGLTAPVRPRRLYVSRSDAKLRRIANEGDLLRVLAEHDFEVVTPGTLSLRDQVALFMGAEAIVGPHGAGLANLLFAPRHARDPASQHAARALLSAGDGARPDLSRVDRRQRRLPRSLCGISRRGGGLAAEADGRATTASEGRLGPSPPNRYWARLRARLLPGRADTSLLWEDCKLRPLRRRAALPFGGEINANA